MHTVLSRRDQAIKYQIAPYYMIGTKNLFVTKENKMIEDIYLEAGVLHEFFVDKTPVDLFRYVDTEAPSGRMIMYPVLEPEPLPDGRVRNPDIKRKQIDGIWYVFPKIRKVFSTFNARVPFPRPGKFYMIPKGTRRPREDLVTAESPHLVGTGFADLEDYYTYNLTPLARSTIEQEYHEVRSCVI